MSLANLSEFYHQHRDAIVLGCTRTSIAAALRFFDGLRERVLVRDSLTWLWQALGSGRSSSRTPQQNEFARHPLHPQPYTDPSLFGIKILVSQILVRLWRKFASERADQLQG